jgi:N-acetylglucosaminyldiphosphoundecaprenol N-acetyl-beta-D-mannosaminyltransferase
MQVVGMYCPPFRPLTAEEDAALIKQINDSGADIVWVGLSTPKQERWMDAHIGKLDASVMVGVGAAFDFHAGLVDQAPKFIQKSGFEWLYRVVKEPKRLWKRYAINNPLFLWSLFLSFTRLKDFSEKPAAADEKAR